MHNICSISYCRLVENEVLHVTCSCRRKTWTMPVIISLITDCKLQSLWSLKRLDAWKNYDSWWETWFLFEGSIILFWHSGEQSWAGTCVPCLTDHSNLTKSDSDKESDFYLPSDCSHVCVRPTLLTGSFGAIPLSLWISSNRFTSIVTSLIGW